MIVWPNSTQLAREHARKQSRSSIGPVPQEAERNQKRSSTCQALLIIIENLGEKPSIPMAGQESSVSSISAQASYDFNSSLCQPSPDVNH
jgi:hypothetical protein